MKSPELRLFRAIITQAIEDAMYEGLHKYNELREADLSHPVEKIGKDLRAMMPWLESTT